MSTLETGSYVSLPAPSLRAFISHYAGVCADGVPPGTHVGQPSRHAHLIISLGAPIDVLQMPSTAQRPAEFDVLVAGLHDAPAIVRRGGSMALIHVFLTPIGVRGVLGVPGIEVASRVFDLSDLWGRASTTMRECLTDARTWPERMAVLDEIFMRTLMQVEPSRALVWAWRDLAGAHGRRSITSLAREIGWSRPHLTERFRAEFGVTPKTAARIFRFERACRLIKDARLDLARGKPRLVDVSAACGFHDQAHMVREWHALAGCSPRTWIASELPFLQDYELSPDYDVT